MSSTKLRALIVDRNERTRAFFAMALGSFRPGFEVATATNARQAEEWLQTFPPDLLLLSEPFEQSQFEYLVKQIEKNNGNHSCKIMVYLNGSSNGGADNKPSFYYNLSIIESLKLTEVLESIRSLF